MYLKRKQTDNLVILIMDICLLIVSFTIAFLLRFESFNKVFADTYNIALLILVMLFYNAIVFWLDSNRRFFQRGYFEEAISVLKIHVILAAGTALFLYLIKRSDEFARLAFGYFFIINILLIYVGHIFLKYYLARVYSKRNRANRMVVISTSDRIEGIAGKMEKHFDWRYQVVDICIIDKDMTGSSIGQLQVSSNYESIREHVQFHAIDEVFIDIPEAHIEKLAPLVEAFETMGVAVDINIPTFDIRVKGKKTLNQVGGHSVVTVVRNEVSTSYIIIKRLMDLLGALVGMLILGLVSIVTIPAIKLESPGPVIFSQTRVGKNGRQFKIYKFRSMYMDAEERKKQLMQYNEMDGLMFKMKDDPRITKVGKFIRKTSIDELPQFINVFKGDMSLVGTRPPTVDEFEKYKPQYKSRLSMTPGLTGIWQVSGRSDITDFEEVIKLDMQYIDTCSFITDVKIILLTVKTVLFTSGAR